MSKTLRRSIVALIASVALTALASPSALAAPTASFTVTPGTPQSGVAATLTSTSTAPLLFSITNVEWDLNGSPTTFEATGASIQHTFPTAGTYPITIRVTSDEPEPLGNQATATAEVTVATRRPTAAFGFNPTSPVVGENILFASNSTDPDNDPLAHSWNFGNGTSTERNPTRAYSTPGTKSVRLTVNDGKGGVDDVVHEIVVRDPSAAKASFTSAPEAPVAGQTVTFTSTSTPSSGQSITAQDWDLDSDGQYDDANGKSASRAFADPGVYRVALRVRQGNGNTAVAEGTVRVGALPLATPFNSVVPTTPPTQPNEPTKSKGKSKRAKPSLMSPFPIVRLRGQAYYTQTMISLLSVRAPRGTLTRVRCKGPGCPKVTRRKRSKGKALRFYTFERPIAAGARLEIAVVGKRRIGKFVRFKMRSYKPPVRKDLCLLPGKRKPRSCRL